MATSYQKYIQRRKDELYHKGGGNPWHDPANGQFTSGPGGRKSDKLEAVAKSRDDDYEPLVATPLDDEAWEKAANLLYKEVVPSIKLDDDYELKELVSMDLADYFYTEYKNYVDSHPDDRSRINDYVEYVKENMYKVDPSFDNRSKQTDDNDGGKYASATHQPVGMFTPDPSKQTVISPGNRGSLQEYMNEYVPGKRLFESKQKYARRLSKIEDDLYRQYIDTSSIKDIKTKRAVEDKIFKEATLGNRDPEKYNLKPGDDYHNTRVASAIDKRVREKSIDFYNSQPKTDETHDLFERWQSYHQSRPKGVRFDSFEYKNWKRKDEKLMKDLAMQAMADCGYDPSENGANFICEMWNNL